MTNRKLTETPLEIFCSWAFVLRSIGPKDALELEFEKLRLVISANDPDPTCTCSTPLVGPVGDLLYCSFVIEERLSLYPFVAPIEKVTNWLDATALETVPFEP